MTDRPYPDHLQRAIAAARAKAPPEVTLGNLAPRAAVSSSRHKVRHEPGKMNATEAEWDERLRMRMIAGEVLWYAFEQVTFKPAHDVRYTPDFVLVLATGQLEAHDTKGDFKKGQNRGVWLEDDARVKIYTCATAYPWIRFVAQRKEEGGTWREIEIAPWSMPRTLGPRVL